MKPTKIRDTYNALAEDYYETRKEGKGVPGFMNTFLEMPTTLKLVGNVKGRKVLDLGCGPGFYSKILIEKGAKVKGIDISEESIRIAMEQNPGVEFKVGDICNRLPYKNSEFEVVLSSLVIGHIEDWVPVLKEIKRVLRTNGVFVFSVYNPVMEKRKRIEGCSDKLRLPYGYFDETWVKTEWKGENETWPIAHHHKTYGTIVRLLVRNGFEIVDYEDAFPSKESKKKYPEEYKRYSDLPNFCTWKVKLK